MESEFDRDRLLTSLKQLPFRAVLAFALSCAERLYPNYLRFSREHAWGDSRALRDALDHAWNQLLGRNEMARLEELRRRVEASTPDTEDFDSPFVSAALDAASAASMVLDFLTTKEAGTVADIASLCRDTVDSYVQEIRHMNPADPDLEINILKSPLMQRELLRQRLDLDRVAQLAENGSLAPTLHKEWRDTQSHLTDTTRGEAVALQGAGQTRPIGPTGSPIPPRTRRSPAK